ncbi:MAG: DUF2911 domain-containing protein [Gemmatimonadaceae bacterium]|nr:DUF2911 domain-containing protein [Chitinophagaceae bacterium]
MKKILLAACSFAAISYASAQQVRMPAPSTGQTVKQELGLGFVELSYSRPNIKDRKVFGDLVPFGKVWRTGANQATVLSFTDSVTIGGKKLAPGKYGLLTIPDQNNWTIIISKQLNVTSPASYKAESDAVRVEAKPKMLNDKVETFTMQFANIQANSADLNIMWENTSVSLPIKTDVEANVMAQINNAMNKDNRPYFTAALYYLNNGKDLNQAVTWFDKAIEQDPKAFWVYHQKANALAKLGKKADAKAVAQKSMDLAKEAKNDDYVALNEKLIATLK